MGLFGDVAARVRLKYEVDTAQAKIELRELSGAQKIQARDAIQSLEDQKKAHEQMVSKITIGAGLAAGAVMLGIKAFKSYEEQTRLSAATAGASMGQLESASRGLLSRLELMEFAAKAMNGRFKLTQSEMENVLGAAVALERRGIMPLSEATDKLADAVKKGEVEAFKELGIAYDENLAKTDRRAAAMKVLAELAAESGAAAETESEQLRRLGKDAEDYYDRAVAAVGRFAVESVAGLVMLGDAIDDGIDAFLHWGEESTLVADTMAKVVKLRMQEIADAIVDANNRIRWSAGAAAAQPGLDAANAKRAAEQEAQLENSGRRYRKIDKRSQLLAEGSRTGNWQALWDWQSEGRWGPMPSGWAPDGAPKTGGGRARRDEVDEDFYGRLGSRMWNWYKSARESDPDRDIDKLVSEIAKKVDNRLNYGDLDTTASDELAAGAPRSGAQRRKATGKGVARPAGEKKQSRLAEIIGPIEEYDAYKQAWEGFLGSMTSGYEAIVTGSESAGKAIRKSIAAALLAEGSQMFVLSLKHGAMALGELALGNPGSAATHGLAAAKLAAGAVAAGIAARALGAGGDTTQGGGAGTSAGASASGVGLRSGGDSTPITRNYIIGDSFGYESPRSQAARFREASRNAERYRREPEGTQFS